MKRILFSIVALSSCLFSVGQTRTELYDRFNEAIDWRDTIAVESIIKEWEKAFPNDAELYSLWANKHFLSAMSEVLAYTQNEEETEGEYMVVKDSAGVEAYMYSYIEYDKEKMNRGKKILEEGITRHPDRLDLRLGKVTLHLRVEEHDMAVQEIRSALERSVLNNNRWTGTLDKPIESDGVSYLRDCILDYFSMFLNAGDLDSAERMADMCIDVYPKDVIFISNKGALRYFANDLKGALKWYLTAFGINPDDMLIATNIANIYKDLGDRENALKYYRIVADSESDEYAEYIEYATGEVKKLSAKK